MSVVAYAGEALPESMVIEQKIKSKDSSGEGNIKVVLRSVWCMLLASVYELMPLQCPTCSAEMKIIAFVTEKEAIKKILTHLGEETEAPVMQTAQCQ